ncbi:ribonuclease J [Falsibacillus albus]|uniref:Ribonuclease J n=1 Tax=Falsibacillus albus TaxID=2478915 RepID=A0A3L7JZW8_9BACI|nr:ribonuclease J [Falsibacillus albus]RLQ95689.1 ribonuclease J [Falsibacillus albus]
MLNRETEMIKIIPLGGVGENGKNMYVLEIDHEMFVIDSGLMFPENEMLGIDIVIPDISYLVENKDRIQGIFLTHGHEDALGSLSYVLKKIKVPVFGTKLTVALAKEKLKEQDYKGAPPKFVTIHSDSRLTFETVEISFFKTTHSIPDSIGLCFHTSEGNIVHTGDFKFDQAAEGMYQPEIGKMAAIGQEGVLCLLSDSTDAERPGYSISESVIACQMSDSFHQAKGRIIVACFASNLIRIQHVFRAAKENDRKVALVGKNIQRVIDLAVNLEYLEVDSDQIVSVEEINQLHDDEIVILTTGIQGEPIEALQKMAKQAHKLVNIQEGDTVFITATPSPGLEILMFKTMDMLFRAGANVLSSYKKVHVSGHGSQEELKLMLNLMKPKYFIPVQGEYRMLKAHAKIAQSLGMDSHQIFIPEKGDVIEYKKERMKMSGKVAAGNVLIDGIGVGDVGNIVLRDRRLLSQDGIFTVVVTLNKKTRSIASGPEIISRGFVYVRESEKLMEQSTKLVKDIVEGYLARDAYEWSNIKQDIRDQLNYLLFEKTKRRPMILPIIMEV